MSAKRKPLPLCEECGSIGTPDGLHRGLCPLCKFNHQPGSPYPQPCSFYKQCGGLDNGHGNECCDRCEEAIAETGDIS